VEERIDVCGIDDVSLEEEEIINTHDDRSKVESKETIRKDISNDLEDVNDKFFFEMTCMWNVKMRGKVHLRAASNALQTHDIMHRADRKDRDKGGDNVGDKKTKEDDFHDDHSKQSAAHFLLVIDVLHDGMRTEIVGEVLTTKNRFVSIHLDDKELVCVKDKHKEE